MLTCCRQKRRRNVKRVRIAALASNLKVIPLAEVLPDKFIRASGDQSPLCIKHGDGACGRHGIAHELQAVIELCQAVLLRPQLRQIAANRTERMMRCDQLVFQIFIDDLGLRNQTLTFLNPNVAVFSVKVPADGTPKEQQCGAEE